MSKELTEQWRNGAIQETYYYVKCPWSEGEVDIRYVHNGVDDWKEIIAPVPSYDEWQELQEASDGLSKTMFKSLMNRFVKADEERERLEDRLREAESLIYYVANNSKYGPIYEPTYVYCQKYGVKK